MPARLHGDGRDVRADPEEKSPAAKLEKSTMQEI